MQICIPDFQFFLKVGAKMGYRLYQEYTEKYTSSVDMVVLNLISLYANGAYCFEEILKYVSSNIDILLFKHTVTRAAFRYAHLFTINCGDSVIKLFVGWNEPGKVDFRRGRIEFNPNKVCGTEFFDKIFNYLRSLCLEINLVRWDYAFDIPISRNKVKLYKNRKKYERIEYGSLTEHLGERNSEGFVKLYDKGCESMLPYNLTRCEFTTCGLFKYNEFISSFPEISIYKNQMNFDMLSDLSQNDIVFLRLLLSSDDFDLYFNQLTYRKREKFKKYIFTEEKILPSSKAYKHCCEFVRTFLKFRTLTRVYVPSELVGYKKVSKHFKLKEGSIKNPFM